MEHSLKLFSECHIRMTFNINLSGAHYDINPTERDRIIKVFDA